jgi:putative DNA primase/helicase
MITESQHKPGIPVLPDEMDREKEYLNVQNGILNLRNGELFPHSSDFMMTRIGFAEFPVGKNQPPKRWLAFIDDITNGDADLKEYIQRAVGYTLTGSTQEQCVFFCHGGGQNGKSTFLEILSDIMGTYSANVQAETLMMKAGSSGGANSDIARLKGARLVTSAEPSEGMRFNEGLLKQLTGGDRVTARFQYGSEFEFVPEFKLWISANNKPIIRGTDNGIWRRLKLIPFNVQIPDSKVDKQLKYKLREELPGILQWALEGCLKWKKDGLKEPICVTAASRDYRQEMDVLANFIESCIERKAGISSRASDVYAVYSRWADENSEYKMSGTKFGREFSKRFDKIRDSHGIVYENTSFTDYARSLMPYSVNIRGYVHGKY